MLFLRCTAGLALLLGLVTTTVATSASDVGQPVSTDELPGLLTSEARLRAEATITVDATINLLTDYDAVLKRLHAVRNIEWIESQVAEQTAAGDPGAPTTLSREPREQLIDVQERRDRLAEILRAAESLQSELDSLSTG